MDSEQVKSATDNIGTFDKSNPDIRYSARTEDAENRTPDMSDIARSTVKIANARGITVETQDFAIQAIIDQTLNFLHRIKHLL